MKSPSTELFTLIHSLTPQEKRYFKLYAKHGEQKADYIRLFDAIDCSTEYKEAELKKELKNVFASTQFKKTKSYLLETILRFLEHHYADHSVTIQLQRYLQRIEVLLKKRLFDLAEKTILKAELLARSSHEYQYLALLLSLKGDKITVRESVSEARKYISGYYPEEIQNLEKLRNLTHFKKLGMIGYMATVESKNDKNRIAELKALLKDSLLSSKKKALSLPARFKQLMLIGNTHHLLGNWEKTYSHYKELLVLLEKNQAYLKTHTDFYISISNDLMLAMRQLGKEKELNELYAKITKFIEAIPPKYLTKRILWFQSALQLNLMVRLIGKHNYKDALELCRKLEKEIELHRSNMLSMPFHINTALLYFYSGEHKKALVYLNKVLNSSGQGIRKDALESAKLLQVFVHYELKNYSTLPYLCRSTAYAFKQGDKLNKTVQLLLTFFGKTILKANDQKEKSALFAKLRREIKLDAAQDDFLGIELLPWLESKI